MRCKTATRNRKYLWIRNTNTENAPLDRTQHTDWTCEREQIRIQHRDKTNNTYQTDLTLMQPNDHNMQNTTIRKQHQLATNKTHTTTKWEYIRQFKKNAILALTRCQYTIPLNPNAKRSKALQTANLIGAQRIQDAVATYKCQHSCMQDTNIYGTAKHI